MNTENKNKFEWYSNKSLKWIWARSAIAAILGIAVVIILGEKNNTTLLAVVISVPLILGVINSMFRNQESSENSNEENT